MTANAGIRKTSDARVRKMLTADVNKRNGNNYREIYHEILCAIPRKFSSVGNLSLYNCFDVRFHLNIFMVKNQYLSYIAL